MYNNFIEEIGLDAIQLGSCIAGGEIYDNFCLEYGTLGDGGMSNGIQIGLGNVGTICERNFIRHATAPITINSYGNGIVLENMNNTEILDNEVVYNGEPSDELIASDGIRLVNSPSNDLYSNAVQAVGDFPNVRNISLAGSSRNRLYCNSTNGGQIGVGFFGTCNNTKLNTTSIGSHDIGLLCGTGTIIGQQEHQGNTWLTEGNYNQAAAEHQGAFDFVSGSIFRVEGSPGSEFWPELISTPNAGDAEWFIPWPGSASLCEDNTDGLLDPIGTSFARASDQKVAEGDYARGAYAVVHNWEAGLDLFDRLEKNETLRNSEIWYQSFYAQANTNVIGDYVRLGEQFKALLSPSDEEGQDADALWTGIQEDLETLMEMDEAYSQAITAADSTALEAAWLELQSKLNGSFADWHQLAADVRQRMENGIPALQLANAALPESIVPAANEKLMNTIQLKRILGEGLTEKQGEEVVSLAFSCPLEAGNAVYRARTLLRSWRNNYVFDDAVICGLDKEGKGEDDQKSKVPGTGAFTPESARQWQLYPNPAKHQLWIAGSQMEELQNIQLFDALGSPILHQQHEGDIRMQIQLPPDLRAGIYFLRLQLRNGEMQTQKILLQP